MLFDIRQFEQVIQERTLKKGLRLFERGELEMLERRPDSEFYFLVSSVQLILKKRGDKLIRYSCGCGNTDYCGHLTAALFYFQQEALGIILKQKTSSKGKLKAATVNRFTAQARIKKQELDRVYAFIEQHNNELNEEEIRIFLSGKSGISLFEFFLVQLEYTLKPFLIQKRLDQHSIHYLCERLHDYINHIRHLFGKLGEFSLQLSLVGIFFSLSTLRFAGKEEELLEIYKQALQKLDVFFKKGLRPAEQRDWYSLTCASVFSNKNLHCEAFVFLLPRCLTLLKKEEDFVLLYSLLNKRLYKRTYHHAFDKLKIARWQLALAARRRGAPLFLKNEDDGGVESILAECELLLCAGEADKAFALLEREKQTVKKLSTNQYTDYLDYRLQKAKQENKTEIEYRCLRENFVEQLFILPAQLDRFLDLVPADEREKRIRELIEEIKMKPKGYSFDKVSALLMKANLLDEMTIELRGQNNKFSLVHEVALRRFPDIPVKFLELYMRHLAETLRQDSVYSYQVELFKTAKLFLDKLPKELVVESIKKLLDQIGKTGHLYRYINTLYDYPFLKEEGNY